MIRLQRFAALPQPKTRFSPSKLSNLSTGAVIGQSEKILAGYLLTNRSSTSLTISRWPSSAFPPPKKHQMLHQLLVVSKYPNHEKPILPTSYQYLLSLLKEICIQLHSGFWVIQQHQFPQKNLTFKTLLCHHHLRRHTLPCRRRQPRHPTPQRGTAALPQQRWEGAGDTAGAGALAPQKGMMERGNWCFILGRFSELMFFGAFWTEPRWFHADGNCIKHTTLSNHIFSCWFQTCC